MGQAGGMGGAVVIGEVGVGGVGRGGGRGEGVESLQAKEKRDGVPEGETETWHHPDGAEQQRAPEGENTGRSAPPTSTSPPLRPPHSTVSANVWSIRPDLRHRSSLALIGCPRLFFCESAIITLSSPETACWVSTSIAMLRHVALNEAEFTGPSPGPAGPGLDP